MLYLLEASDCQVLFVYSAGPEHVSVVTDIAYPVELVLHLICLHEVLQELFDNLIILFKTGLL